MNKFASLSEAAEYAVTRCNGWRFAYSEEAYNHGSLLGIAEIHDEENPADDDSFYLVSPSGAIGFSEDGESIDWLFLSLNNLDEDLPDSAAMHGAANFCPQCGSPLTPQGRFCESCGARISCIPEIYNEGGAIHSAV